MEYEPEAVRALFEAWLAGDKPEPFKVTVRLPKEAFHTFYICKGLHSDNQLRLMLEERMFYQLKLLESLK